MPQKLRGAARLLGSAAVIAVIYLVGHLAGLRQMTSTLSGTLPATELELALGLVYIASWFAFVLVAPIFVIAAAIEGVRGCLLSFILSLYRRVLSFLAATRPSLGLARWARGRGEARKVIKGNL